MGALQPLDDVGTQVSVPTMLAGGHRVAGLPAGHGGLQGGHPQGRGGRQGAALLQEPVLRISAGFQSRRQCRSARRRPQVQVLTYVSEAISTVVCHAHLWLLWVFSLRMEE